MFTRIYEKLFKKENCKYYQPYMDINIESHEFAGSIWEQYSEEMYKKMKDKQGRVWAYWRNLRGHIDVYEMWDHNPRCPHWEYPCRIARINPPQVALHANKRKMYSM